MKKIVLISLLIFFTGVLMAYSINDRLYQQKWVAPKDADRIVNPLKGNSASIARGKIIFNQFCFICHGTKGKGDGIAGAALKPKPANLTTTAVKSESDGAMFWKITTGRPPMAKYKEILDETKRWDVINYIRTLK